MDSCAQSITSLDLDGYHELNDLIIDYIVGNTEENVNDGLKNLREIKLPKVITLIL